MRRYSRAVNQQDVPVRGWEIGARWGIAAVAFIVALVTVITNISARGFWIDELFTLHMTLLSWPEMIAARMERAHPPLYFVFIRLWLAAMPALSEAAIRAPSIFFYAVSVVLFAGMARRFMTPRGAAFAVTLFALNNGVLMQALNGRQYMLTLLVGLACLYGHLAILQGGPVRGPRRVYLVGALLGAVTSPTIFVMMGGLAVDAFHRRRENRPLFRASMLALSAAVVAYIPVLVVKLSTSDPYGPVPPNTESIIKTLNEIFGGFAFVRRADKLPELVQGAYYFSVFLTAGSLLLVLINWARLPDMIRTLTRAIFVPFVLMASLDVIADKADYTYSILGSSRYVFLMIPAAAMIVGHAFTELLLPSRWRLSLALQAACLALLGITGHAIFRESPDPSKAILHSSYEPFREAMEAFGPMVEDEDVVIIMPEEIEIGVEHYLPGIRVDERFGIDDAEEAHVEAVFERYADSETVYLLRYRDRTPQIIDVARRVLGPFECLSGSPTPERIDILKFHPRLRDAEETSGTAVAPGTQAAWQGPVDSLMIRS